MGGVISERDRPAARIYRPIVSAGLSPALASGFGSMAIKETMMGAVAACRIHLAVAAALAAAAFSLASAGPSFAAVAGFFWPLLVSTGALLVVVAVLLRISPLPGEASGEGGIADFVAGCPEVSQLDAGEGFRRDGDQEPRKAAKAEEEEEEAVVERPEAPQ